MTYQASVTSGRSASLGPRSSGVLDRGVASLRCPTAGGCGHMHGQEINPHPEGECPRDERLRFFRGLLYAVPMSLVLWGLIIAAVRWFL